MKIALFVLLTAARLSAHRLDEYLQGAMVSIQRDRVQIEMTLTPGVAIFPLLIPYIDTDGNGIISAGEQRVYVDQVLRDLSLQVDGRPLTGRVKGFQFPAIDEMKAGRGEIQLQLDAEVPRGGTKRTFGLENRHMPQISVYQVNALATEDPRLEIAAQDRNYSQSDYQLKYVDGSAEPVWQLSNFVWILVALLTLASRPIYLWGRYRTTQNRHPREA